MMIRMANIQKKLMIFISGKNAAQQELSFIGGRNEMAPL